MMWKTLGLAAALMLGSAVPALAESACQEPIAPAAIDGSTASAAQLKAAVGDVKTFLKQSDDYQDCMWNELKATNDKAKKDKKDPDPQLDADTRAKVAANQKLKEKVGNEYNAAAQAYNAKHPG
jgi:Skp family chaperone for outer membrane proteins